MTRVDPETSAKTATSPHDGPVLFRALHRAQEEFCISREPYPALIGGVGSGKTWAGSRKLVVQHVHFVGSNSLVVAPTYQLAYQVCVPAILDALECCGVSYMWHQRSGIIETPDCGGSKIYIRSGLKPERIVGIEVGQIWIDEPARIPWDGDLVKNVKAQCLARLRSLYVPPHMRQLMVTGTHEGPATWLYLDWESDRRKPGHVVYRAATTDNPYMWEFAKQLGEQLDEDAADQYLRGHAAVREINALSMKDISMCVDDVIPIDVDWESLRDIREPLYAGMDIGRTRSLSVIWICSRNRDDILLTRGIIIMRNAAFSAQRDMIGRLCSLRRMERLSMDATYNPQLAEEAEERYGSRIDRVIFSPTAMAGMVDGMRNRMQDRKILIPRDEEIHMDLCAVKQVVRGGRVQYVAPYTSGGHADRFWAMALVCRAAGSASGPFYARTGGSVAFSPVNIRGFA